MGMRLIVVLPADGGKLSRRELLREILQIGCDGLGLIASGRYINYIHTDQN